MRRQWRAGGVAVYIAGESFPIRRRGGRCLLPTELPLNPRYERWRWQTFGITWLIYASYYLTRQAFNAAKVVLADGPLSIAREQLGRIDATYLTVYSLGQFFFGPLSDRFGPRKILLCGMGLSVLAAVGFGFSTTLVAFLAFAALQGLAQSTG